VVAELSSRGGLLRLARANPAAGPSFTAIIEREGNLYVALCPELDIASQGSSVESALKNLKEAVDLVVETADPKELKERRRELRD